MNTNQLNVAIIGSGPAGLYAAVELLRRERTAVVHIYDRLLTPGGLVRYGVSPDHSQRRLISEAYENLAISSGRYFFHGNIEIGKDLTHETLQHHHHAIIYACGAAESRQLGIAGEKLKGSHTASEFINWYNGHPDYSDCDYDLKTHRAVVIGNGNVALDIARMILLGEQRLKRTDIADHALRSISDSTIKEVVILGRRGPNQAGFTLPEILELDQLNDTDIIFENADFSSTSHKLTLTQSMRADAMQNYAGRAQTGRPKKLIFRFLTSPVQINGVDCVDSIRTVKNCVIDDAIGDSAVSPSTEYDIITTGLVVQAVGYRGTRIPDLPYDERKCLVPNIDGRVIDGNHQVLDGTYVAGWLKRGPNGVIGSNKFCSAETINSLLQDWADDKLNHPPSTQKQLISHLRKQGLKPTDLSDWRKINFIEKQTGSTQKRPRVKITSKERMLSIVKQDTA
jgi:ferredoxin/flavodoxin---NADP+ reductase